MWKQLTKWITQKSMNSSEVQREHSKQPENIHTGLFLDDNTELTEEQARAYFLMEKTSRNLFITGKAGSGKSITLKFFRNHTSKRIAILAPTGVAAINVEGQTIHSFFKLRIGPLVEYDPSKIRGFAKIAARLKPLDAIVIDEISMVRADILDAVDKILRKAKQHPDVPFGGCQMIFFGDPYQLPPVMTPEDQKILNPLYTTGYFFESKAVINGDFHVIEFLQVLRQKNLLFIDTLNKIRTGNGDEKDFALLATRVAHPPQNEHCVTLTLHKATANEINYTNLMKLQSRSFFYDAEVRGEFFSKTNDDHSSEPPAAQRLELRVGATVIMMSNDREKRWVNGTLAVVHTLTDNRIDVAIGSHIYSVNKYTWSKYIYEIDPKTKQLMQYEIGTFTQYPIALAYAITIHKSQGQTYDRVCIDYAESTAFAPGQTYVALSRCRNLDGLYLASPISEKDIIVSPPVVDWMTKAIKLSANDSVPDVIPLFPCEVPLPTNPVSVKSLPDQPFEWLPDGRIKTEPPVNPKKITGRRFPQVLGRDPYSTPFQAWCAIMRLYEPTFDDNQFTKAGKVIQPKQTEYIKTCAQQCSVKSPEEIFGNNPEEATGYDFFPDQEIFGGMWDAIGMNPEGDITHVFEMKTTSENKKNDWAHSIPLEKFLQGALYAYLLGLSSIIIVPSFLCKQDYNQPEQFVCGPENTIPVRVKLSIGEADFERDYIQKAKQWWEDYVLTGVSPPVDPHKDAKFVAALKEIVPQCF